MNNIDTMSVNAIRVLSADAIQKAKSGHPGLPLGCASVAYELWAKHLKHNPKDPDWKDRDRFILSGGHGSMLLYSLLHLFGYGDLKKEDLIAVSSVGFSDDLVIRSIATQLVLRQRQDLLVLVWVWQLVWQLQSVIWHLYLTRKDIRL